MYSAIFPSFSPLCTSDHWPADVITTGSAEREASVLPKKGEEEEEEDRAGREGGRLQCGRNTFLSRLKIGAKNSFLWRRNM